MARIKYNPFKRDFIFDGTKFQIATGCEVSEAVLRRADDSGVNTAIEQAKATPDNWVDITPHKSYTLRAYR